MVKSTLRKLVRKARGTRIYLDSLYFGDQIATGKHKPSVGEYSLLLAATGRGNIGDQAMLDAYLENTPGDIVAVTEGTATLWVSAADKARVTLVPLAGLLTKPPILRFGVVRKFARLLDGARTFSITGADMMEGLYSAGASMARVSLLNLATRSHVRSRVLGFSWGQGASSSVTRGLIRLDGAAELNVRDPKSFERMEKAGIPGIILSTDTVFALSQEKHLPEALQLWIDSAPSEGIAVVNVSGLIGGKIEQIDEYEPIVKAAHSAGLRIVFLPHVLRSGDDDLAEVRRVATRYASDTDFVVGEQLWPSQVRVLTKQAFLTVTGRMHLSIMSLSQHTPVITLGTHGKVEGLHQMFELDRFVVEPQRGFGADVALLIGTIAENRDELVTLIRNHLPAVTASAEKTFV